MREVKNIEKQFVMLLGFFVDKYCNGPAEISHSEFVEFMEKEPQLEMMDGINTTLYKVTFGKEEVNGH